ncbi:MAG: HU family DNA-binding protein [Paracoccaceae bacterium]|nr:HU family DNA-binding protein [Paracoccaceae bacterium]
MAKTTRTTTTGSKATGTRRKTTTATKTAKAATPGTPAGAVAPPEDVTVISVPMTEAVMPEANDALVPPEAADTVSAHDATLVLKKKDFIERVVLASGVKRGVARDVSDAVLKVLGEALSNGESLMLPPLGKLRVARQIDRQGTEILQIKLRRPDLTAVAADAATGAKKDAETDEDPLAEADD